LLFYEVTIRPRRIKDELKQQSRLRGTGSVMLEFLTPPSSIIAANPITLNYPQ